LIAALAEALHRSSTRKVKMIDLNFINSPFCGTHGIFKRDSHIFPGMPTGQPEIVMYILHFVN
jgi:hypothetical protein